MYTKEEIMITLWILYQIVFSQYYDMVNIYSGRALTLFLLEEDIWYYEIFLLLTITLLTILYIILHYTLPIYIFDRTRTEFMATVKPDNAITGTAVVWQ